MENSLSSQGSISDDSSSTHQDPEENKIDTSIGTSTSEAVSTSEDLNIQATEGNKLQGQDEVQDYYFSDKRKNSNPTRTSRDDNGKNYKEDASLNDYAGRLASYTGGCTSSISAKDTEATAFAYTCTNNFEAVNTSSYYQSMTAA